MNNTVGSMNDIPDLNGLLRTDCDQGVGRPKYSGKEKRCLLRNPNRLRVSGSWVQEHWAWVVRSLELSEHLAQ